MFPVVLLASDSLLRLGIRSSDDTAVRRIKGPYIGPAPHKVRVLAWMIGLGASESVAGKDFE